MILTAINGRAETRSYTKPVRGGRSGHNRSDEERAAITLAMGRHPDGSGLVGMGHADLRLVRDDPERVKAALAKRGPGVADQVDRLLEADAERRRLVTEVEALRAEQKRRGREVAKAAPDERERVLAGLRELSDRLDAAEDRLRAADATLAEVQAHAQPAEEAVRLAARRTRSSCAGSAPPKLRLLVRDHLELGELLGAIDTVRAAKVSKGPLRLPGRAGGCSSSAWSASPWNG